MASRLSGSRQAEGVDYAAAGPHCGVCRHVRFRADWDRTPYCTAWEEPTELRVGEVCSGFEPMRGSAARG